jgi:hypothetical protein
MSALTLWFLLGSLVLLGAQVTLWQKQRDERAERLAASALLSSTLDTVTHQMALVGQQVLPITVAYQQILVKELTHFHTPDCDRLLAKLGPPFTLTASEEIQLLKALKQREDDMGDEISESERDAAHILPIIIKRIKLEQGEDPTTFTFFQTVSFKAPLSGDEKPT